MTTRRVVVWLTETTWKATVDAAAVLIGREPPPEVTLLHVADSVIDEAAHGAFIGLPGRGSWNRDPAAAISRIAAAAAQQLLDAAERRLGQPATLLARTGHVEHEVLTVAGGADVLVCARDGNPRGPGPHSLARATRHVVDHAPCAVLLVWPEAAPHLDGPPDPPQVPPQP